MSQARDAASLAGVAGTPRFRSIVVGLAFIFLLAWLVPYVVFIVKTGSLSGDQIPPGAFLTLVLLARFAAPTLRRLFGRQALTTSDVFMSYAMVLGCITMCSNAMLWYLVPISTVPFYADGGMSSWAKQVVPHLPTWLVVGSRPGEGIWVRRLFEGNPSGQAIVPWNVWLGPMSGWLGMLLLMYFTGICVTGLFRRRWFEQEHITFPLAELTLAVGGAQSSWDPDHNVFRNKLLWLGFALPFIHVTLGSMPFFFKGFPDLNFKDLDIGTAFTSSPWNVIAGDLKVRFQWFAAGFAYLIPAQVSIGTVFFYFASRAQMVFMAALGATGGPWDPQAFLTHEAMGGLLVFAGFIVATARRDLSKMWRDIRADIAGTPVSDPHPDRWFLVGALAGTAGLIASSTLAGLQLWVAVLFIVLVVAFHMTASRIVAVLGMQSASTSLGITDLLYSTVGTRLVGRNNIPGLAMQHLVMWFDERSTFFPMVLQAHKLGDVVRWRTGRYVTALLVGGAVALGVYSFVYLRMCYQHGGLGLNPDWYFMSKDLRTYQDAASQMASVSDPHWFTRFGVLFGAAVMWALMTCHRVFPWWPFHPLGFVLIQGFTAFWQWPSLLVGWICKSLVSKYGGERSYFVLRPLFLGLLIGEVGGRALWVLITALSKAEGWVG